ncbi:hypothetical protein PR048_022470 [Dryococelus australis]|uniref:Uncharacterized protein n=1 Tax=Dryococelus australis TaxID=614101 RepID=A0ABQ9H164_9NEOP|nr:hypothetical protein PR048_022470 [Dryococelus australis]
MHASDRTVAAAARSRTCWDGGHLRPANGSSRSACSRCFFSTNTKRFSAASCVCSWLANLCRTKARRSGRKKISFS